MNAIRHNRMDHPISASQERRTTDGLFHFLHPLCPIRFRSVPEGPAPGAVNLMDPKATYTATDIVCSESNLTEGEGLISPDISFLAVPVNNSQMDGYKLTLNYYDEQASLTGDPTYEYEFDLKNFSPDGWMSGHRIRYVLKIDNSIHLSGYIVDFEDVDYLEGVMLPDIPGTK